jgi:tetratricopeptide (TPR) repeat protein
VSARALPGANAQLSGKTTMDHAQLAVSGRTAEETGEIIGAGLVLLLVTLGILKCLRIMRRPTTSKLCVSALLLFLMGWFLPGFGKLLARPLELPEILVSLVNGVVAGVILLAALILAIVGLCTYDRKRFVQGRAQATWALILSSIGLLVMVGAGLIGAFKTISIQREQVDGTTRESGKPIEKPEFNFGVNPSSLWVSMKPEAINKAACLAMRRLRPETFFVVIGEHGNGLLELDLITEVSKSNLASAVQVLQQTEEESTIHGMRFGHVTTRARLNALGKVFHYEHWVATEHGFAWQIVFWGDLANKDFIAAESRKVMETFRVLDPTRDGTGQAAFADVSRPELGYSTKLEDMGWSALGDGEGRNALIDFGAQRSNEALVVVPVRFGAEEPPDMQALTRALLNTLGLEDPAKGDYERKAWQPGYSGEGAELTTDHEEDGDRFHYVLRVGRHKRIAHLIAGWAEEKHGDMELVRRSLDAITLQEPVGTASELTAERKDAFGKLLNEVALCLFERKEFEQAAALFRRAFEETSANLVILQNAGNALEEAGKYAEGRNLLAPHVQKFAKRFDLGLCYARLQALGGDPDAGNATFCDLIERGLTDEDDFLGWLELLTEGEHYPQALHAAEAWVAKHPTANARRGQAKTLFAAGRKAESVALLEKLLEEKPNDVRSAQDLGTYYNDAGEHSKAEAIAKRLLSEGKDEIHALMILGWSQMGRKWYRDAKATFERASKQEPEDEEVLDAIRHASAMLGQGDNSSIREPIQAVAIPQAVAAELSGQGVPQDFGKGHDSAWLLRVTGWDYQKGKRLRRTTYRRVKVLSAEGARDLSSVEITFDPLDERIFMNRLEVKDADGKVVSKGSPDDAYVRDLDDDMASHDKVLHMQVSGVQPGHVVEWEATIEDLADSRVFPFKRILFANPLPVAVEAVFVTGDVSTLKAELAQGDALKALRADRMAAWIAPARPPTPDEPFAVWPERRCPMLWIGGDEGTWEKVGAEYLKQIEDRLKPDKPVEELAAKLTAGVGTESEKVTAIARHVQREYGYRAIEFGVRARRPNAAVETMRLRHGDCKDHALLLQQLLRATGVESHLALVSTGWRLQLALPSLDQFDHMVVHVPHLAEGWLIDATDKSLDVGRYRAGGLLHAHALILDPAKPRVIEPQGRAPLGTCDVASRRTVTPSGMDWRVEETLTAEGYYAASLRAAFTGLDSHEQSQKVQRILGAQGAAQVQEFRFEHLDEPARPAILQMTYAVRSAIPGGGLAAPLPALWERDYLEISFVKERLTVFEWLYPMRFTSHVTVNLPAQVTEESAGALRQQGQSDFCAWKLEPIHPSGGAGQLELRFEFHAKPGEHPAARYADFHDGWEAARRAWDRPLSWAQE